MSEKDRITVTVQLLNRSLQLNCSVDERPALLESANLLDQEMKKLASGRGTTDYEKVALVSALNLADEVLKLRISSQEPPRSALSPDVEAMAKTTLEKIHQRQQKQAA